MLFVLIYIYWCPTRFPCKMMFESFNSNSKGATSGTGTANSSGAPEFTLCFLLFLFIYLFIFFFFEVLVLNYFFFISFLSFCLSFDLRILNTPFAFSNNYRQNVDTNTRFMELGVLCQLYLQYRKKYKYTLYAYCVGTTVCIMSSQLCKQYHYETHSVVLWCGFHNRRDMFFNKKQSKQLCAIHILLRYVTTFIQTRDVMFQFKRTVQILLRLLWAEVYLGMIQVPPM